MIPRYIWQIWQLSIKLGYLPTYIWPPSKNLCWYLVLISHPLTFPTGFSWFSFWIFTWMPFQSGFFTSMPPRKNGHPSFVGSIGFLTTQETGATGGAANVQQCQRLPWWPQFSQRTELGNSRVLICDLTKIIQKWCFYQKHIFDCPIYTLKSRPVTSITQVSSPFARFSPTFIHLKKPNIPGPAAHQRCPIQAWRLPPVGNRGRQPLERLAQPRRTQSAQWHHPR